MKPVVHFLRANATVQIALDVTIVHSKITMSAIIATEIVKISVAVFHKLCYDVNVNSPFDTIRY